MEGLRIDWETYEIADLDGYGRVDGSGTYVPYRTPYECTVIDHVTRSIIQRSVPTYSDPLFFCCHGEAIEQSNK